MQRSFLSDRFSAIEPTHRFEPLDVFEVRQWYTRAT